jgi:type I restriction enzyme, R subunit
VVELEATLHPNGRGALVVRLQGFVGDDGRRRGLASAAHRTFTSAQLRFVNEVIDYLAHNGTITVDSLYLSPFKSIAPGGPEDLFPEVEIEAMAVTMHSVTATAVPA